jgi:hypothetical protein
MSVVSSLSRRKGLPNLTENGVVKQQQQAIPLQIQMMVIVARRNNDRRPTISPAWLLVSVIVTALSSLRGTVSFVPTSSRCLLPARPVSTLSLKSTPEEPFSCTDDNKAWQSHVSTHPDALSGLNKILDETNFSTKAKTTTTSSNDPDVAFLFVGQYHAAHFESLVGAAHARLPVKTRLLSVVGGGVIGENIELDEPSKPSLALLTGCLPPGRCSRAGTVLLQHTEQTPSRFEFPHVLGSVQEKYLLIPCLCRSLVTG